MFNFMTTTKSALRISNIFHEMVINKDYKNLEKVYIISSNISPGICFDRGKEMAIKREKTEVKKFSNPISAILIFLIIFYNKDTFPSINNKGYADTIFILIGIIGGIFLIKILTKKLMINYRALMITILFFSTVCITMLINSDYTGGHFVVILSILLGFMLIHLVPFRSFTNIYVNIMVILGIYSILALYMFMPISNSIPDVLFPRFNNIAGLPIINARFSYIVDLPNYYRNFGIFREAGVYQVFLNIALLFELFYKSEKPRPVILTIIYITIISTFSTPGYIAAFILTIAYVLSEKKFKGPKIKRNKNRILPLLLVLFLIAVVFYQTNDSFNKNITMTLNKLGSQESSYLVRTIAVFSNITVWAERPIFGHGIESGLEKEARLKIKENLNAVSISSVDNTSTIGAFLVAFGIVFTILYVYLVYKLIKQSNQNRIVKVLIFLSIMTTINTQLLIYNELLYVILFYGLFSRSEQHLRLFNKFTV
jgi:hypothetical protein